MKTEKNRVHYQETIQESIERIPFLKRFFNDENETNISVYTAINDYAGYDTRVLQDYGNHWGFVSSRINAVLQLAEARGDL